MSKKRAFVRYSKQGKIVPGSLILTSGSYPNGPSTWKEVPADLCCGGGGGCTTPIVLTVSIIGQLPQFPFVECTSGVSIFTGCLCGVPVDPTWEDIVLNLNSPCSSWIGSWEIVNNNLILNMNCEVANILCSNGTLSIFLPLIP